jgi:Flp pilus assembly protein TadD
MPLRATVLCFCVAAVAGCGSSRSVDSRASTAIPTFSKDVAPILRAHCVTCHRPGQGTPFNLETYTDAKSRADDIATATASRQMPPWLPDPVVPGFVGERRLASEQIATLRRWADSGRAEGDPLPPPVASPPVNEWSLGKPDLVLQPDRPYALGPAETDVFRNLVVRLSIPMDRFVRAVEFRPESAPVHHAVIHLDRTDASRNRDGQDGQPGFEGMGGTGTQDPEGHFLGWAPGRGAIVSAEGRPWRLPRGADIVLELHLIPKPTPTPVRPRLAIYFADRPENAPPIMFKMGSKPLDIPAGASRYQMTDEYTLPADVDLLSLYPHAHFLGKDMLVLAQLPAGSTRTLLHIPRWSFHWQQDYRFTQPLMLPSGTKILMRFTYDNSESNPDNPHHPPVRVMSGQRSTDEMGNLLLQFVPRSPADRAHLVRDLAAREAAGRVALAEQMVRANPASAEQLTALGASYADADRCQDAIPALESALRLDPASWKAHHELGGALFKCGRLSPAIAQLREAARLRPAESVVQFNLGKALSVSGAADAARAALTRAVTLNPQFAEAHEELGVLFFAEGRTQEAIRELRKAVELSEESAVAHSDLGGALAQAGQTAEAIVHLRRALALDPDNAAARDNLARLQRIR